MEYTGRSLVFFNKARAQVDRMVAAISLTVQLEENFQLYKLFQLQNIPTMIGSL